MQISFRFLFSLKIIFRFQFRTRAYFFHKWRSSFAPTSGVDRAGAIWTTVNCEISDLLISSLFLVKNSYAFALIQNKYFSCISNGLEWWITIFIRATGSNAFGMTNTLPKQFKHARFKSNTAVPRWVFRSLGGYLIDFHAHQSRPRVRIGRSKDR